MSTTLSPISASTVLDTKLSRLAPLPPTAVARKLSTLPFTVAVWVALMTASPTRSAAPPPPVASAM